MTTAVAGPLCWRDSHPLERQLASLHNIVGAKKFLVDYTTNFKRAFLASQFYNFPCFPNTVPDLKGITAHDDRAPPPDKCKVLDNVLDWATNVGFARTAA
jgi:hypothetical protein